MKKETKQQQKKKKIAHEEHKEHKKKNRNEVRSNEKLFRIWRNVCIVWLWMKNEKRVNLNRLIPLVAIRFISDAM